MTGVVVGVVVGEVDPKAVLLHQSNIFLPIWEIRRQRQRFHFEYITSSRNENHTQSLVLRDKNTSRPFFNAIKSNKKRQTAAV